MLEQWLPNPRLLGLVQAAITIVLSLLVVLLARRRAIHLERETLVALIRGLIQVVAVGSVLLLFLQAPLWTSTIVLVAMLLAAASIAARRSRSIPGAFRVSLLSIALGSGLVIGSMTLVGVIRPVPSSLIPVGSMLIAGAMNINALALERFRSEVMAHTGQIEAALALGAAPSQTVEPYVQAAVEASLIPRIDSLRSLGIVWIPGLMAGMVLSGEDPVYSAIYQFVVITMLFATGGLTAVSSTLLIRSQVFTPAQQLILRPGTGGKDRA